MTLPVAKLVKLIPLLGSPVDGEALGAARAIERACIGAGRDLHDLAALIERGGAPTVRQRMQRNINAGEALDLLGDTLREVLTSNELNFVTGCSSYRDRRGGLTEKQSAVLVEMYARVAARRRAAA